MRWSEHCFVGNVYLRQCHSHGRAQIILNNFLPDCLTENYTLLCIVAIALHRFYKCVREHMLSDIGGIFLGVAPRGYKWKNHFVEMKGDVGMSVH